MDFFATKSMSWARDACDAGCCKPLQLQAEQ